MLTLMTRAKLYSSAKRVRLLALDVDGVLTDRRMIVGSDGQQIKSFDVRDGFGLVLARRAGLKTAFITSEKSPAVAHRAKQLKIDWIAQAARSKRDSFRECLAHFRLQPSAVCYMGDDLLDLPVLTRVGLSATVADAHPDVIKRVDYVASLRAGRGAVRELVEFILKAQGLWARILKEYLT
ncbi:MAG: HAD hydrolase family protein [Candidatus Omnitrophica bacterium]|nr:HAD hydrolase family protein [Candidatus Omnitrophota bacterium]